MNGPKFSVINQVDRPIFIVGAPRSGTTLLRVMLNRHAEVGICDETYFFYYVFDRRKAFGDLNNPKNRKILVNQYLATRRIRELGLDSKSLADHLMNNGETFPTFFLALMNFYSLSRSKSRYGEKTPQHALYIKYLVNWYPECKILHLIRDPRDVVASLSRMPWGSKNLVVSTRDWRKYTQAGIEMQNIPQYRRIGYEELVAEPERVTREICEFIGIAYDPAMVFMDQRNEPGVVSSQWWFQRAKEPLSKDRIGTWQESLDTEQAAIVEWVASPLMEQVGYSRVCATPSVGIKAGALLGEKLEFLASKKKNLGRSMIYWFQPTQLAKEEQMIDASR